MASFGEFSCVLENITPLPPWAVDILAFVNVLKGLVQKYKVGCLVGLLFVGILETYLKSLIGKGTHNIANIYLKIF